MLKRMSLFVLTVSLVGLLVSPAYAYQTEPSPWNKETTNEAKTLAKFKFGLKNLFFGWTEIFNEPREAYKNKEGNGSIVKATARGIFYAGADTALGVLHVITSPLPGVDLSLPEGGVDF